MTASKGASTARTRGLSRHGRHAYIRFYPSDWMAGTARLPRTHKSVYFDICCYIWDTAKPCPPIDLVMMLADVPDRDQVLSDLEALGKIERLEDGSVSNVRALAEAKNALSSWKAMAEGGKKNKKPDGGYDGGCNGPSHGGSDGLAMGDSQEPRTKNHDPGLDESSTPLPPFDPDAPPCPAGVDAETWEGFMEVRKRKNAPVTERAYGMIIKKLAQSASPEDAIATSVMNGWTGVFANKGGPGGRTDKKSGWLG